MTAIQKLALKKSGVILSSIAAGPDTNTAPTITISTTVKIRITSFVLSPKNFPTMSGKLAPFILSDIMPER